jgi:hypothetical protein
VTWPLAPEERLREEEAAERTAFFEELALFFAEVDAFAELFVEDELRFFALAFAEPFAPTVRFAEALFPFVEPPFDALGRDPRPLADADFAAAALPFELPALPFFEPVARFAELDVLAVERFEAVAFFNDVGFFEDADFREEALLAEEGFEAAFFELPDVRDAEDFFALEADAELRFAELFFDDEPLRATSFEKRLVPPPFSFS